MIKRDLAKLTRLRKSLHEIAELSGHEKKTAGVVLDFMKGCHPDIIVTGLGGNGLACVFEGAESGLTVTFRSELDALPIEETNDFPHRSRNKKVSHKCGHDGHMAMLAGLGLRLGDQRPTNGRVVLLFQPAEESGLGARRVIGDSRFQELQPDYIFALHNLPGYPLGRVVTREGILSGASRGMVVKLIGVESHAAYPEDGRNPAPALTEIIHGLWQLPEQLNGFSLVTIIHARLGEIAFGTSPGYAEVMATLRAQHNDDMDRLVRRAVELVTRTARKYRLNTEISWRDKFSATINHGGAVRIVEKAAKSCGLDTVMTDEPFRWSEDFGEFLDRYRGALFGAGAGEDHPQLHSPHYEFPDALIETGICILDRIVRGLLF